MSARLMIGDVPSCECPYCRRPFEGLVASLLREPRLVSKISVRTDGCWEWVGARDRFGYGIVARDYFGVGRAHRAVYLRRRCRECNRAAQRRRDAKRKAAA